MNAGRDCTVHLGNGQHEAIHTGCSTSTVEAYGYLPHTCAAGSEWEMDPFSQLSISWHHSIVREPDFVSPFRAIQQALQCRSEISLQEGGFMNFSSFRSATSLDTPVESTQPYQYITSRPLSHVLDADENQTISDPESDESRMM